jgi:hypothetical protein
MCFLIEGEGAMELGMKKIDGSREIGRNVFESSSMLRRIDS